MNRKLFFAIFCVFFVSSYQFLKSMDNPIENLILDFDILSLEDKNSEALDQKLLLGNDDFYFKAKNFWSEHGHEDDTTFLWWKHCSKRWKWQGKSLDDIDIPLIPDGFSIEIVDEIDDYKAIYFRCDSCENLVQFKDMWKLLSSQAFIRNLDLDFYYYYCKNCSFLMIFDTDETSSETTDSSMSDSQEDEDSFWEEDFSD